MRKSPFRHIVYPLQAVFAWGVYGLLRALPIDAASAAGGFLARAIGPLLPVSGVAQRNLCAVMPELSAADRARIIRQVWDNLGRVAGEFPHIARLTPRHGRVQLTNPEFLEREFGSAERPIIFFSGHFANWEMLPATAAHKGMPLSIIYRQANNPYVNRLYMFARRRMARAMFTKNRNGAKALLKGIKEGHPIGMLVDQKMNDGISIPLLGRPAMTAPAIAEIALKYDVPVYPVRMKRLKGAYFEMEVLPALIVARTENHSADVKKLLTTINQQIGEWIRADPGQWLWLHRRWGKEL